MSIQVYVDSFKLPASVSGDMGEIFRRLSEDRLPKKEKTKLLTIVSGTIRAYQFMRGRPMPEGKICKIAKTLELETDDVAFVIYFKQERSSEDANPPAADL